MEGEAVEGALGLKVMKSLLISVTYKAKEPDLYLISEWAYIEGGTEELSVTLSFKSVAWRF